MADKILCYLARHGETALNAQNCFRGNVDAPLAESGLADAHNLAGIFKKIKLWPHIISSDKRRAVQTATIIAEALGMGVKRTPGLRAWNVGSFSGKPKNEENLEALDYYIEHPNVPPPTGESLEQFKARVRPVLAKAVETAFYREMPVLLVVHSSIIHEAGEVFNGDHSSTLVKPGGIAVIALKNSKLVAKPLYRPLEESKTKAETVS